MARWIYQRPVDCCAPTELIVAKRLARLSDEWVIQWGFYYETDREGDFIVLFLAQLVFAQQPTPILPDSKLTPGDTFDVTAQDVCVPGYAKKVRAVPAWLKDRRTPSMESPSIKTGDYEVDHLI